MSIPVIAGLYPYTRGGVTSARSVTLQEIPLSLRVNLEYKDNLIVFAGDKASAEHLERFGLSVYRTFSDAPLAIHWDAAHKMKHWMCMWALHEFGEFLWVDWDTVALRPIDDEFVQYCRSTGTPKFNHIMGYWATVNCGVYYAPQSWLPQMERSFDAVVEQPNDELLWASVLPDNIADRSEFWWGRRVVQINKTKDISNVTKQTYFAHVEQLDWAAQIRTNLAL